MDSAWSPLSKESLWHLSRSNTFSIFHLSHCVLVCVERWRSSSDTSQHAEWARYLQTIITAVSTQVCVCVRQKVVVMCICSCVCDNRLYEVGLTDKSLIAAQLQQPNSSEEVLTEKHHNPLHLTRAISCNTCNNTHLAQSSHQRAPSIWFWEVSRLNKRTWRVY